MNEAKEPLKLYLDDDQEPFKVAYPPLRFHFNTIALPDGPHRLRVEASNGLAPPTIREIPFQVRNGVAITVYGLEQQQTIGGQVELIINAYAGNTEVDFEPRRAETPQPIPTWSWVLFLAITAWGMFYVLNPTLQPRDAVAASAAGAMARSKGQQIYVDTCARCHGEDGAGQRAGPDAIVVPPLRNSDVAVAETPERLLSRVVAGIKHTMMPAWGPRLSNEEILAVVNTVRTAWDHNGSTIEPRHRTAPPGVQQLEATLLEALRAKDSQRLGTCCWPPDVKPQLYRVDGIHEMDLKGVSQAWNDYLDALGAGRIENLQLLDARYDYDTPDPTVVVGWGRMFLDTVTALGKPDRAIGRFIRVYQKSRRTGQWAIAFDFADIPMRVGCLPTDASVPPGGTGEPPCPPPGQEPEVVVGPPGETPASTGPAPGPGEPPGAPGAAVSAIGYAEVQTLLRNLKKGAKASPHDNFWELSYAEFVAFEFEDYTDGTRMRLLLPYDGKNSNLVKAMRSGKGVSVTRPDGTPGTRDLVRMPKNAAPMADADIDAIERWIDAGAPEFAGKPSALPRPSGAGAAPGGAPTPPAPEPGGFPAPGPAPAPGGFPAPGPAPAPAPAPGPQPGGGFPAPAPAPQQPGGFPAPAPAPGPQPGGGFPAPAPAPQQPGGFPAPAQAPGPGSFPPPSGPGR